MLKLRVSRIDSNPEIVVHSSSSDFDLLPL